MASTGVRQTPSTAPTWVTVPSRSAFSPRCLLWGLQLWPGPDTPLEAGLQSGPLGSGPPFLPHREPWELGDIPGLAPARICCSVRQAIRAHSSASSLRGVDSNSRAALPSWQENGASVHCGVRGAGSGQAAEGWAGGPVCGSPVWPPAPRAGRGACAGRPGAGVPGEASGRLPQPVAGTSRAAKRHARPHGHERAIFVPALRERPRRFQTAGGLGWPECSRDEREHLRTALTLTVTRTWDLGRVPGLLRASEMNSSFGA